MDDPVAIDGADGPLVVRRLVVWRRLEPGDARTPGTELAPENDHIEAKVVQVGISEESLEEMKRLHAAKVEATAVASGWMTRYEPAGVLFAAGGGMAVGVWLDYLPGLLMPFAGSVAALGVGVGAWTRAMKQRRERAVTERWSKMPEREALSKLERKLEPRWKRFAAKLLEDTGFRVELRVGDVHEAERLLSLDPAKLADPATWEPDPGEDDVRYGWAFADGRVLEQQAELEDTGAEVSDAEPARDEEE